MKLNKPIKWKGTKYYINIDWKVFTVLGIVQTICMSIKLWHLNVSGISVGKGKYEYYQSFKLD